MTISVVRIAVWRRRPKSGVGGRWQSCGQFSGRLNSEAGNALEIQEQ